MSELPIDWDAVRGWRGKLRRPVQYQGERFEYATVARSLPERAAWWLQLRAAQFWPVHGMEWWEERYPGMAVPQDQPVVAEEEPPEGGWLDLPQRFLATEWRPEIGFMVDHYELMRETVFEERLPRRAGPDDGLIEALANVERSRRHGHS